MCLKYNAFIRLIIEVLSAFYKAVLNVLNKASPMPEIPDSMLGD